MLAAAAPVPRSAPAPVPVQLAKIAVAARRTAWEGRGLLKPPGCTKRPVPLDQAAVQSLMPCAAHLQPRQDREGASMACLALSC
mmetsp:Transcript_4183/g.9074  ORF Transcript_4183/g.9074 Transcript_4183/m.9074 type:complete len:84 (+) Transcript_4183:2359-2610(+)